jgi:pimeloyl-ACP methyl ester carboxylesterase
MLISQNPNAGASIRLFLSGIILLVSFGWALPSRAGSCPEEDECADSGGPTGCPQQQCMVADCQRVDNCWKCVYSPACAVSSCYERHCIPNEVGTGHTCSSIVYLCDDHNRCTYNNCSGGVCSNPPCPPGASCGVPTDPSCDDGNPCTDEICLNGECAHEPHQCPDSNVCDGTAWCDPATTTGSPCKADINGPLECDDGNPCNGGESCHFQTGCVGGVPLNCDDQNVCTDNWCEPNSGCSFAYNTNPCDDGNFCTIDDHCQGGSCYGGEQRVCQDANNADGDLCNGWEECNETQDQCVRVHVPPPCDDNNACTDDRCIPATGLCEFDCFDFPSEWEMPETDDRTFVGKPSSRVISGGTVNFAINVTRYAGPTRNYLYGDHTLYYQSELVQKGLATEFGELTISSFGSSSAGCDRVFFNDSPLEFVEGNPACLEGSGCDWSTTKYKIPLYKIKFPGEPGGGGNQPLPEPNEIRIQFATTPPRTCIKVAGAVLTVKLTSPIILIHGNSSDGDFFVRQGFARELAARRLVFDNSISFDPSAARRSINGVRLSELLPQIVASYGVDSVHLVTHSKGGLDVREFLQRYYSRPVCRVEGTPAPWQACDLDNPCESPTKCRPPFRILSFTTLSAPHNGSVMADIQYARSEAFKRGVAGIAYAGFPAFTSIAAWIADINGGTDDLRTDTCAAFNPENVAALGWLDVSAFHTVGADADLNGNGRMDNSTFNEAAGLSQESVISWLTPNGIDAALANACYQILRRDAGIRVDNDIRETIVTHDGVHLTGRMLAVLTEVPSTEINYNDFAVTYQSARGRGSFEDLVSDGRTLVGPNGRNHCSIANEGTAASVIPKIIKVEKADGDLR